MTTERIIAEVQKSLNAQGRMRNRVRQELLDLAEDVTHWTRAKALSRPADTRDQLAALHSQALQAENGRPNRFRSVLARMQAHDEWAWLSLPKIGFGGSIAALMRIA